VPHRDQTKNAQRRAAFTGEDLREAKTRLSELEPGQARIPAALPEQAALEADTFGWLARPREYAHHPFHIRALDPQPDQLDLYSDESATSAADLLQSVLPTMHEQHWATGVLGLRITAWNCDGVDLRRPGSTALIRLHGAPKRAWRQAAAELAQRAGAHDPADVPWQTSPSAWTKLETHHDPYSPSRYDPSSTWLTSGLLRRIRIFKSTVPTYCADGWPTRDTHRNWKFDITYYEDLDPRIEHLRQALIDPDYGLPLSAQILHEPDRVDRLVLRAVDGGPESLLLYFSECSPGSYWAKDEVRAKEVRAHAERVAAQPPLFAGREVVIQR